MKKAAFFCIPAHGHTNPMLPVAAEMVKRGNKVRFYSFDEFKEKIEKTGAEFISCDKFLPELTDSEKEKLKNVSQTEMSIQDIRITLKMNDFLEKEFKEFQPDVVYTDSVCFWGTYGRFDKHVCFQSDVLTVHEKLSRRACRYDIRLAENHKGT